MGAPERLLRLYPRAWRERYQEEFLATAGRGPLGLQQTIDIVSGAIDAWLSAEVRDAVRSSNANQGGSVVWTPARVCEGSKLRYTKRDAGIGAAVMLLATVVFSVLGIAARRYGWAVPGEVLLSLAFPGSLSLSMPFWLTKGQPWKAQVVMVGGTLALLVLIASLASVLASRI